MKIYWYDIIDDYVFEDCFKNDYYDYDLHSEKERVWQLSSTGRLWHALYKTENMEFICEVK
jgi:hypothetical protein